MKRYHGCLNVVGLSLQKRELEVYEAVALEE